MKGVFGPGALGRRRFLEAAGASAAAGLTVSCRPASNSWRFFTEQEARTVAAICARLIPSDDAPGATEAGVVNYIDLQLAGFYRKHRKAYRAGIAALDAAALLRHGAPFAGLPAKEQTSLLAGMERDPFFELVLAHAMQGFYGSPRHGGNRGGASWRMLGIPEPPVRGRLKYERS